MVSRQAPLPTMARIMLPRELLTWGMISLLLGAVEGGLVGVIVKNTYSGTAPDLWINMAVALTAGAPAFANLSSYIFANWAQGRDKVRAMSNLMVLCTLAVVAMGMAPLNAGGLVLLVIAMLVARVAWSGVITLRATVWRMNYSRAIRARITGRIITQSSVIIGLTAAAIGAVLNHDPGAFRWLYPLAALSGLAAAMVYRKTPLRRSRQLAGRESADRLQSGKGNVSLGRVLRVLRDDGAFRNYMGVMMLFGAGNLMLMAPLIIILNDHFALHPFRQVLITSTIPLVGVASTVFLWARMLDRLHIIDYRARQSWAFVAAQALFMLGAVTGVALLFWFAAITLGVAFGGAVLGWNLGHNDFASEEQSALYMGAHVTLTGLRGLLMPAVGVLLYELLSAWRPEAGPWVMVLPFLLTFGGALLFVRMSRLRQAAGASGGAGA